MKIIEIVVAPDGQTRVETQGFTGAGCQEASRFVELALGKVVSDERTSEFFEVEVAGSQQWATGGDGERH